MFFVLDISFFCDIIACAKTQRYSVTVTLRTLTPSFKVRILIPLPKRKPSKGMAFRFGSEVLEKKISIEDIMDITGLSKEEIENLTE